MQAGACGLAKRLFRSGRRCRRYRPACLVPGFARVLPEQRGAPRWNEERRPVSCKRNTWASRLAHGRRGKAQTPWAKQGVARGFRAADRNCPSSRHSLFSWQSVVDCSARSVQMDAQESFYFRLGAWVAGRYPDANLARSHGPRMAEFARYCAAHPLHCWGRHASNPPVAGLWPRTALLRGGRRHLPGQQPGSKALSADWPATMATVCPGTVPRACRLLLDETLVESRRVLLRIPGILDRRTGIESQARDLARCRNAQGTGGPSGKPFDGFSCRRFTGLPA